MQKLFFIAFMAFAFSAFSQKPPIKFGDVPLEDLKMTIYDKDSSAAAVVLADYGESSMTYNDEKGFRLNFERITRIKILTKDGLSWGDFSIPLYHSGSDEEKVSGIKAVTYNLENGKVVESKLKSDAVFREKTSANYDQVKVSLPNVKAGSVVEIKYEIVSDFIFNFQDWDFQYTIPARWSEYRARIPEYFHYDKYTQGYIVPSISEETSVPSSITLTSKERSGVVVTQTQFSSDKIDFLEKRFRWAAKDAPAFKEEPFMTSYRDFISSINFELAFTQYPNQPRKTYTGSWEDINKLYAESESFGGEVTGNGFLKKTVEDLTAGLTTPEAKIAAIHAHVKNTYTWDGTTRSYVDGNLRKVVDAKKGNSGELNLLLASMLEKAEIEVYPVLISTRDHGFLREYIAASSQFNNVICYVPIGDKQLLLDATEKLLPIGFLPERCLNGKGLAVSKKGYQWVKLTAPVKSRNAVTVDVALAASGEFTGNISIDRTGYFAQRDRKKYFSKGEADYVKDFVGERSWEVSKSEFLNQSEIATPFKETHTLEMDDQCTVTGSVIYLNPLFKWRMDENPFKLEQREYPVDFGSPFDQLCFVKIKVPDGYVVEEAPQSKVFMLPEMAGKFSFNVNVADGKLITVTTNLQINRSIFAQTEYEALREFYSRVVAIHAEQIVLKKQ